MMTKKKVYIARDMAIVFNCTESNVRKKMSLLAKQKKISLVSFIGESGKPYIGVNQKGFDVLVKEFGKPRTYTNVGPEFGSLYIISLVPDLKPGRIKIGWSTSLAKRVLYHKTSSPTSVLVKSWPCKRSWEKIFIDMLKKQGEKISVEVFDVKDLNKIIKDFDNIFNSLDI